MAPRTKTRYLQLNATEKTFFSKILNESTKDPLADLELLRNVLTKEKAKLLHAIKTKKPSSIYHLSKIMGRDQKSIRRDLKTLERFGFIDYEAIKKGKKTSYRPYITTNKMILEISI